MSNLKLIPIGSKVMTLLPTKFIPQGMPILIEYTYQRRSFYTIMRSMKAYAPFKHLNQKPKSMLEVLVSLALALTLFLLLTLTRSLPHPRPRLRLRPRPG